MKFDLSKRYCYYFNELAKLPHGSGKEKPISDFVVNFAQEHGLKCLQDEIWNVIIYKDASAGYEDAAPLMIQAHMDMVCEKNGDSNHDFDRDPLDLFVEDGKLMARGTTLGADDCAGVAYMLALLEDETLQHPALDCVFTVMEETGLNGAKELKAEDLRAHRMISLDGGGETSAMITSAGGCRCRITKAAEWEENTQATYRLAVRGLSGGHSGQDIHLEKGNANKLVARGIKELQLKGADIHLVSYNGGLKDNAIPRESEIVFTSSAEAAELEKWVRETENDIKEELAFSDSGFHYIFSEAKAATQRLTRSCTDAVIDFAFLMPDGFQHRSMAINGLTITSLNLGVVNSYQENFLFNVSLRSGINSGIDNLIHVLDSMSARLGLSMTTDSRYPAWNYSEKSAIRDTFTAVVKEQYGEAPEFNASHGGTECGIFKSLIPDMDIVAFGPIAEHIHTPDEELDLASFDRTYRLLCGLVSACR